MIGDPLSAHITIFGSETTITFPEHLISPDNLTYLVSLFSQRDEVAVVSEIGRWDILIEFETEESADNLIVVGEVLRLFQQARY